ncbi:50S ribosomal protein L19 [Candidatus Woesebacteria bacterium RIFCSPHIGHO2_02_FULL_38_9]|uniref:50S ribosomal protein L19 n=1 Tax=Candidatus Woesebacteria bacterium RIFCSPHIGHO2_01_FULL_39_28 TaxID=1802496 RepID=A0A1F7YJ26_9BACT|nr:MAG: 50S ribosomal protein L19 [Candidatus Woesebacteria bacterium RIFCSPHIGHO2_01_FULL_39_28]OGM31643.1 MAG: 50S ribosomal protein L19 [Candidatus Woesebacteria bacterium RIFCSPHIGHO2_02_FULL_38_9]OGM56966.1 MAG: 50S ribosomal protein L19 [Candidatus Woesebacteria bacterium RIFCSPLOWO2_01_FULL_38_20]
MALIAKHNDAIFGVGDAVKVCQQIKEGEKIRTTVFEGMVIGIKGRDVNKSFTVRRIGVQKVGIERIFPLFNPTITKINVVRKGTKGVRHAKLYYTRSEIKKDIEKIYSRALKRKS